MISQRSEVGWIIGKVKVAWRTRNQESEVPWWAIEAACEATPSGRLTVHRHRALKHQFTMWSIITNSIQVWKKTEKMTGSTRLLHRTSPLLYNYHFQSGGPPFTFPPWLHKGIYIFSDVFNSTGLFSFRDIKEDYDLLGSSYFLYLRLGGALKGQ